MRIGYTLFQIDLWTGQQAYLKVDNTIISPTYSTVSSGTNLCGANLNDAVYAIDANFTHSASTMAVEITSSLTDTPYK